MSEGKRKKRWKKKKKCEQLNFFDTLNQMDFKEIIISKRWKRDEKFS